MSENMTQLLERLAAVTTERDHWKANHDNRVRAAKILMDRTDMPLERIGAYKQYVAALEANQKLQERAEAAEAELLAVREDNHSMMLEIHNLRIERDALAAELAKLREQKPVAWMHDKDGRVDTCHASVKELWIKVGQKQNTQFMREIVPCMVEHYNIPLYAAPVAAPAAECRGVPDRNCAYLAPCNTSCNKCGAVHSPLPIPAPAVPDWNVNIQRIRDVMHMLGISIDESVECFSAALPTNINRMTQAMKRHLQKLADMTAATAPNTPAECELLAFYRANRTVLNGAPGELVEVGQCCYGGLKPKRDCASCAAWKPVAPVPAGASIATPEAIARAKNWPAVPTPTPFIPDADTRCNDAEFAAQQASTAPSVADDLAATIRRKFTSGNSVQVESIRISRDEARALLQSSQAESSVPEVTTALAALAWERAFAEGDESGIDFSLRVARHVRALLQSANHSEHVLEKVAPDCRACANRGRANGLSQESYCDSCIYQGRDWRENHFVDASKMVDTAKRRCEACAILPCSCE